jgi:peptidoglycan hydrolase-like protein with peptidoglycan-binding domain
VLRRSSSVTLAVVLAAALAGCTADTASDSASPVAATASAAPSPHTPGREPVRTPLELTAAVASPSPVPATSPAAPPPPSFDVAAVQRQLTEQRYYVGPVDGKAGAALRSAVMAFQKVNGLGVDGGVGPATLAALAAPRAPQLQASSPADRVEIDLTKQVLYVVKGGAVNRIMPVSSGNGATYKQKDGSTARALSPVGWYKIQRRIVGERKADLGTLYDPQYFYKGWAIHGSNSVPAGPASHGCVRVPRNDAKWLLSAIGNGMSVYLYGGKHVFTAGSSAPGTENPSGDGAAAAEAPASEVPAPTSPEPQPAPSSTTPPPESPSPSPSEPAPPPQDPSVPPAP